MMTPADILSEFYRRDAAITEAKSRVAEQIDLVQAVTGWSDRKLADAFPGETARETVNRWKRQADPNLRPENVYRLGVLVHLAESMATAGLDQNWLRQPVQSETETPYDLVCAGRLGDVQEAVDLIAAGNAPTAMPRPVDTPTWDEHFDDDDGDWIDAELGQAGVSASI